ncbi:hypothetical protein SAMN05421770_10668 [Granulicella rosea]|uniref:Uncharacterized protein n=1 Tax=Granulicella rosea TaxID=474952 RepID=A0A239L2Q6_9BACT|nr:hypothetical protein [Granulicella rosea]SNT24741.1 hypothetical protein SAMN05421770_10668 [Granulicella rosea]
MAVAAICLLGSFSARAEDPLKLALKAAKRSTLDQPGTHPFHLRATVTPSFERDKASNRTGEIEFWWKAPGEYRRDLHAPGFHQVEIVSAGHRWQKNEGDYLPDWLDETANALVRPLPAESAAMHGVEPDQQKAMFGSLYLNWEKPLPMDMQASKQDVAITDSTGLLFYDGGLGWGALFKDYAGFHGRDVPRTVTHGSPEVTAKVVLLEDLPPVAADWFNATATGGDPHPIVFVAVDSTDLSADLVKPAPPLVWPDVPNTRADGVIWTNLVLDREGHIREPFSPISDNPALNGFLHDYLAGLQFKPVMKDGQAAQTIRHVVLHFNLGKPVEWKRLPKV